MALNTSFRYPPMQTPTNSEDLVSFVPFQLSTSVTSTDANYLADGDIVEVAKLPANYVILDIKADVPASGTATQWGFGYADDDGSGTNYTILTTITTANTAAVARQTVKSPDPSTSQKILAAKISGAAVLTAGKIRGYFVIGHKYDVAYS